MTQIMTFKRKILFSICYFSRRKTSFHEAGHALSCFKLNIPFTEVSIIPEFSGGIFEFGHVNRPQNVLFAQKKNETYEKWCKRKNEFLEDCIISEFCGGIAEEKFLGKSQKIFNDFDLENVYEYIGQMEIQKEDLKKVVERCRILAEQIINDNWDGIGLIAEALLKTPSHELNKDEIRNILEKN